jgi:hypothetical protein
MNSNLFTLTGFVFLTHFSQHTLFKEREVVCSIGVLTIMFGRTPRPLGVLYARAIMDMR